MYIIHSAPFLLGLKAGNTEYVSTNQQMGHSVNDAMGLEVYNQLG